MPAGRPSKYSPEMCEQIEATLSEGFSVEVAAADLGVHKDTVYEWMAIHKEFSDAIKRGRAKGRRMWEKLGLAGAAGKVDGFNAASWIFNMKNRYEWTDKQQSDVVIKSDSEQVSAIDAWLAGVTGEETQTKTPKTRPH